MRCPVPMRLSHRLRLELRVTALSVAAFAPSKFGALRVLAGITDDAAFSESLQHTIKIRLSEGASNAFFFFSADEQVFPPALMASSVGGHT